MKRVNVHLDEALDVELAREAARTGESKAALLRRAARILLDQRKNDSVDGWAAFTGAVSGAEPDDRHHDDVIYR
ncbi:MAG: CopG family transcriptional regulator [Pseudonocardia sp.]